ncbi:MAG TPA: hypothetical protein VGP64_02940 [Polyangia bacterium]|jgi:hypothetical protein
MKPARTSCTSLWPLLALVTALAGCAGAAASKVSTGTGGSTGGSCQTLSCVPKILSPLGLAVEIVPPAASGAGLTQTLNQELDQSSGPLSLVADSIISVAATFTAASNAPVPSNANIVLDVPSVIPGRPNLIFQAPASTETAAGSTAQLSIPQGPVKRMATGTLSLIPIPPSDQQSPPYSFSDITFDASGQLVSKVPSDNFPNLPSDNFTIGGTLQPPSAGQTLNTFVARAFQGGIQVSNGAITTTASDGSGSFLLQLPSAVAKAGSMVTVQLSPQSTPSDPMFVFRSFMVPNPPPAKVSLGTVRLPPYLALNQYNLPVLTADTGEPVSGVIVQMQLDLGTTSSMAAAGQMSYPGSTQFARSATTNSEGIAVFSLLPGNPTAITYTAVAMPPPGSPYATTCTTIPVGIGANGATTPGAPTLQPGPTLARRIVMSGKVQDSGGRGVANVTITATPGNQPVSACASLATTTTASPATATTDTQGRYSLFLDPGAAGNPILYQLDYDPPAGAYVPRFTQPNTVPVDDRAPEVPNDVTLPIGALVAGTVTDSSQNLLPSATVRLFDTSQCPSNDTACTTPPLLRGQAVTNAAGQFQIVLWPPP